MRSTAQKYWNARMNRWGKWSNGGRTIARTQQDALEAGLARMQANVESTPADYAEEAETDQLLRHLKPDQRAMARAAYVTLDSVKRYGRECEDLCNVFLQACAANLGRMLKQRQRGESIDPNRRTRRPRVAYVKLDRRRSAAVQVD